MYNNNNLDILAKILAYHDIRDQEENELEASKLECLAGTKIKC